MISAIKAHLKTTFSSLSIARGSDPFNLSDHKTNFLSTKHGFPKSKALIVSIFLILAALSIGSKVTQEFIAEKTPDTYVIEGNIVSQTNDSGYYLRKAENYSKNGSLSPNNRFPENLTPPVDQFELRGNLLPLMLSNISYFFGVSTEGASRILVFLSSVATALAAFFFFTLTGNYFLGIIGSLGSFLSWATYSRTMVGMTDTDHLNLMFFLLVMSFLTISAREKSLPKGIGFVALAGLCNLLFFYWYSQPFFTIVFLVTLLGLCYMHSASSMRCLKLAIVFIFFSNPEQVLLASGNLIGFFTFYIEPRLGLTDNAIATYSTIISNSIQEKIPANGKVIEGHFGSWVLYFLCLVGWLFWGLSNKERAILSLPPLGFLFLFHFSGNRFGFYIAPFLWVGMFTLLLYSLASMERLTVRQVCRAREPRGMACTAAFTLIALFLGGGVADPRYVIDPPRIYSDEILDLKKAVAKAQHNRSALVTWWDNGYEASYYSGLPTIVNEGSQLDLKVLYIARGLMSSDPYFSADEFRFASYFSSDVLKSHFPLRPTLSSAIGVDHDLLIFIPTTLERKIQTIRAVSISDNGLQGNSAPRIENSLWFVLFHQRPDRYGPFVKHFEGSSGAVIYRLQAPQTSK